MRCSSRTHPRGVLTIRTFAFLRVLLLVQCCIATGSVAAEEGSLLLEGRHLFIDRDDLSFADPDFDDSGWRHIDVPGSWQAQGIRPSFDVGWYRIHFLMPRDLDLQNPAIQVGLIARADEVYLNGIRIGGEGRVGPGGSNWHNYAPAMPRLYPFDRSLLRAERKNVLAVRVARQPYVDEGGIVGGPVALVDYRSVYPAHATTLQRYLGFNLFLFGVEFLVPVVAFTAFVFGSRDRIVVSFLVLSLMYLATAIEENHALYLFGVNSTVAQFVSGRIVGLIWIPLLEFSAAVCGRRVGIIGRLLQIVALAASIGVYTGPDTLMTRWSLLAVPVIIVVMLATFVLIVWWAMIAVWNRRAGAWPLLFGLAAIAIFQLIDIILPTTRFEILVGRPIAVVGVFVFQFSLAVIVGLRMLDTERALRRANANALKAHAEERRRLARDIHDGIGQWLSTIKLNLQLLNSEARTGQRIKKSRVEGLVDDVSHAIDDTRRIAHDLAPAFLEEHGLLAAIHSHCDRVRRMRKVEIAVSGTEPAGLDASRRDHLYRLFQEALKNALDHSHCTRIEVTLQNRDQGLVLLVNDNGRGVSDEERTEPGTLGLVSMAERAQLIGGKLDVRRLKEGGTSIRVVAPLTP